MTHERRVLILLCLLSFTAMGTTAWTGTVRTVCASGCEFSSLQEAVDSSEWGATIHLGPGLYVENVELRGAVTIRGAGPKQTIIDGGLHGAAFRLGGSLGYRVQLEDLAILGTDHGWMSSGAGELSLQRCVVRKAVNHGVRRQNPGDARRTSAVIASGLGDTWRSEYGYRSSTPSLSSTDEHRSDAESGGLSEIAVGSTASDVGVTLCHVPPGNSDNAHTVVVGEAAVSTHLDHGDRLGACPEGVHSPVPQTGQTDCYDETGNPIACIGTGQDGEYQLGASMEPRFTDNGDGTATDNLTNLVWLQDANCFGAQPWQPALDIANTLANGSCGLSDGSVAGDWRLPNIRELNSLTDYGNSLPALTPDHPFFGVQLRRYWSSTSRGNPLYAWDVSLIGGAVSASNLKTNSLWVWPVRSGS